MDRFFKELRIKLITVAFALIYFTAFPALSSAATLHYNDPVQEDYVTSITGLSILGTIYDATFHSTQLSFNDLWDGDGDGVFGNDNSVFNAAPTFWIPTNTNSTQPVTAAAAAVLNALGSSAHTTPLQQHIYGDLFMIPYLSIGCLGGQCEIRVGGDRDAQLNSALLDISGSLTTHKSSIIPLVSFSPVPVPAAVWLFGTALVGLFGFTRKKKVLEA